MMPLKLAVESNAENSAPRQYTWDSRSLTEYSEPHAGFAAILTLDRAAWSTSRKRA